MCGEREGEARPSMAPHAPTLLRLLPRRQGHGSQDDALSPSRSRIWQPPSSVVSDRENEALLARSRVKKPEWYDVLQPRGADVRRLGVLSQLGEPASEAQLPHIKKAAEALGKEVLAVEAYSPTGFSPAFARLKYWRADAMVKPGCFSLIASRSSRRRPSTIGPPSTAHDSMCVGGLLSYGVDYLDSCRPS
jgi:hypothetical protein